ncbi:PATL3 [Linum perenne]
MVPITIHTLTLPSTLSYLLLSSIFAYPKTPGDGIIRRRHAATEEHAADVSPDETTAPPPPKVNAGKNKSLLAMMEKEEADVPPTKSVVIREELAGDESEEKLVRDIPQSLVSFKEESNRVSDLSDLERKALDEFRKLVQEALISCSFASPPSPAAKEEIPTSVIPEGKETEDQSSDVSTEVNIPPVEKANEETATAAAAAEVSIWGIPLLKDDRSDVVLLKFLRARDFKIKEALTMLKSTIQWRKEFKIDELVEEDLGCDDLEKVVFMHGHDRDCHPVCYNVFGEFQNKELYQKTFSDDEKRTKFLRWRIQFLEKSISSLDFRPGGVSTIFQVNDLKNSPGPGKKELRLATKQALQLLQDNYPEFVAKQVFINVPWWYLAFYTMMSPFMTQRTKSKFVFASSARSPETLFKYIPPEEVPIQYGGMSVDDCDCNPEFAFSDPVTDMIVKPGTKQTVVIIIYEKCVFIWEIRVVGWEVSYGAEFVPDTKGSYTVVIQKPTKMTLMSEAVVSSKFKVSELGKMLLTIDNPTAKKKRLLYRFKIVPLV